MAADPAAARDAGAERRSLLAEARDLDRRLRLRIERGAGDCFTREESSVIERLTLALEAAPQVDRVTEARRVVTILQDLWDLGCEKAKLPDAHMIVNRFDAWAAIDKKAADRAPPAPRPEAVPDRAQVLDRYMSLHGATLADRREAERYLAYVLDGPDREGVPPLRGSGAPAPTVEAMAEAYPGPVGASPSGVYDINDLHKAYKKGWQERAFLSKPADPAPAALAGAVRDGWRPMSEEPTDRPITARKRLDDGSWWYARVQALHDEETGFTCYSLIHYNGEVLLRGFRGPFDGWCEVDAALPAEGAAGDGWLPIETAPKTDGEVHLYCADTEEQFVCYRTPAGWQYAWTRDGYAIVCVPTHWRPLPAPPRDGGWP